MQAWGCRACNAGRCRGVPHAPSRCGGDARATTPACSWVLVRLRLWMLNLHAGVLPSCRESLHLIAANSTAVGLPQVGAWHPHARLPRCRRRRFSPPWRLPP